MILEEPTLHGAQAHLAEAIRNNSDYAIYHIFKNNLCVINSYDKPDTPPGMEIWELGLKGGTFVIHSEDIGIIFSCSQDSSLYIASLFWQLRRDFIEFLRNKGLNVIEDNNDILVDNYKVCGFTQALVGNADVCCASFNFIVDLDLIRKICKKPMIKIPKALSDFGITREEIIDLIKNVKLKEAAE